MATGKKSYHSELSGYRKNPKHYLGSCLHDGCFLSQIGEEVGTKRPAYGVPTGVDSEGLKSISQGSDPLLYAPSIEHEDRRQRMCVHACVRACLCAHMCPCSESEQVKVAQSCPTLCHPMHYTVHGILQARTLEWVAFPFSRGSSQPRDQTQVPHIAGRFFTS